MNSASKLAAAALFLFPLAGCAPKNAKTATPPQAQAPAISAGKAGAMYPPPLTEAPSEAQPATPAPPPAVAAAQPAPAPAPAPQPTPRKSTSRKPKPSPSKPAAGEPGSTQTPGSEATTAGGAQGGAPGAEPNAVAANAEPAAASPIGELAPADTPEQAQKVKATGDLIGKTEDGLNSIKRPLSAQEQETISQIKAFLAKAKTALDNQDFDGAYILATKAKVLLDELNKT
jgi:hypothetical protein